MTELVLENNGLRLMVLPELGGKLTSLVGKRDGREHLLAPLEFAYRPAKYGAAFDKYDTSGFDECFPTVGACKLPDGTSLPDHGELWPVAWEVTEQSETSLTLAARGKISPYIFRRRVTLDDLDLHFDYEVENASDQTLPFLWSCHPLLRVAPDDRIVLPTGVQSVQVEWSAGERLAGQVAWNQELSILGDRQRGWADKLFAGPLQEGWCRLAYSDGATLTFRFSPEQIPYVGLWICQGGWPGDGRAGHFTVALEPCTAPFDRLDQAMDQGHAKSLAPGQTARWSMVMEVRTAGEPIGPELLTLSTKQGVDG